MIDKTNITLERSQTDIITFDISTAKSIHQLNQKPHPLQRKKHYQFLQNILQSDEHQQNQQNEQNRAEFYVEDALEKIIKDIEAGVIDISRRNRKIGSLPKLSQEGSVEKEKYLDPEEHKKLMIKFNRDRKKFENILKKRWLEIQEKIKQKQQQQKKNTITKKQKQINERKQKIQQRLNQINQLKQQRIQKLKIANIQEISIKNKKPLQQIYQQKYKEKVVLPKLEEQKKILDDIKNQRKPMNFNQIKQHQEKYLKFKEQQSNSPKKRFQKNWTYTPPAYVSKSYLSMEEEERKKNEQKENLERMKQQNQVKKELFIQFLYENFKQKIKQLRAKKAQQKNNKDDNKKNSVSLQPLDIEKVKQKGNDYLQFNKKQSKRKVVNQSVSNIETKIDIAPKQSQQNNKPLELIELKKQMRIKNQNSIRSRHLNSILDNKNKSNIEKLQLLKLETQRLDELAKRKSEVLKYKNDDDPEHNETVDIILTSIKAKIGILHFTKKNKID